MSTWLAAKQALTAMDRVMRGWARDLGLDECGVMVLLLLRVRGPCPAWQLALLCGRVRQQVHRSLRMMERRGLVEGRDLSARGRVQQWALTERGRDLGEILEGAMAIWDRLLGSTVELPTVVRALERMVETMVNGPSADGWRLLVPDELRREPIWFRASLSPEDREAARERARRAKEDEIAQAWNALWK